MRQDFHIWSSRGCPEQGRWSGEDTQMTVLSSPFSDCALAMETWHNPKEGKPLPYLPTRKTQQITGFKAVAENIKWELRARFGVRGGGGGDVFPAQFHRSIYELLLEIPDPTLLSAGRKSDRKLKPGQKAILSVKAWSLMGPGAFSLMRCASSTGRQWDANSLKAKREADTGGQGSCAGEETQTMQWQTELLGSGGFRL